MLILTPLARPPMDGTAVGIAWTQAAMMSRKLGTEYFILILSGDCIVFVDASRVLDQAGICAESCRQQVEK